MDCYDGEKEKREKGEKGGLIKEALRVTRG